MMKGNQFQIWKTVDIPVFPCAPTDRIDTASKARPEPEGQQGLHPLRVLQRLS